MNEEPIRVAHIIGKWSGGGVESFVMNYYRSIDRSKIQFDFICDEDSINIPYDKIHKLGGEVILIPPYQRLFKYHKILKKVFQERKYKIVHSHINTISIFPLGIAKKVGIPFRIAHSHSTSNKKEWKKNLIKNILKPFSKKNANMYLACSEIAGRYLFGDKTFEEGKVKIINNAIDLDKFDFNEEVRNAKRKELEIKDNTVVIGNIGRFVKQKNHNFLLDIFNEIYKQNNNTILLLVGQGPLQNKIKQKVEKLGLNNVVKFIGQRDDVNEIYQAIDVFLLPSLYEGLGMVLVEAQVSGCYCIASTQVPNNVKMIEKMDFIDLDTDSKIWATKIIKNIKEYKRESQKKQVEESGYNIKKEKSNLESIYIDLINQYENEKNKICHIVCGLKSGGVEAMIFNYCSNMDKSKYEWHLLYQHEPSQKNIEELRKIGFRLKRIASKAKHPIKNYIETYKYLKNNKINVVHCHMTLMNFIPLIAANQLGIKIRICHSHNSDVRNKNIFIKRLNEILKRKCIQNATNLLACGEEAGKYMYGNSKFTIINNAIELSKFEYNINYRNIIRKKHGIKETTKVIGNIGRFTNQKNHFFIIDLFNEIQKEEKNVILMLIGDGELKSEIERKVKLLHLEDKVIFTGIVPNVNEYYSAFDLFILPSLWEGLPVVGIEAQVSGLKCFFSENIDRNIIIDNKKSFMLSIELYSWKNKIIESINSSYSRKIDIENFKDFNINEKVKKLIEIYNS